MLRLAFLTFFFPYSLAEFVKNNLKLWVASTLVCPLDCYIRNFRPLLIELENGLVRYRSKTSNFVWDGLGWLHVFGPVFPYFGIINWCAEYGNKNQNIYNTRVIFCIKWLGMLFALIIHYGPTVDDKYEQKIHASYIVADFYYLLDLKIQISFVMFSSVKIKFSI